MKEQLRTLLITGSLEDAAAKNAFAGAVARAGMPETNRLYRTVAVDGPRSKFSSLLVRLPRGSKPIHRNKRIKGTARGSRSLENYKVHILLRVRPGWQHERSSQQIIPR